MQKNFSQGLAVSGTGHRLNRLGGYNRATQKARRSLAIKTLTELAPRGVISGMALGWDQALAEAAIALKLPWLAAIPCAGQERTWPPKSQAHYQELLSQATKVIYCSREPYAARLMHARNVWMVDRSQLVIALWDGSPSGTGNCVHYANSKNIPVLNLWDHFQAAAR